MGWRAFKNQVFEQVRHAGFAIALVPRTHEVRDADEDLLLARVGIKQEPKAVVEAVLGNALDGCHVGCNRGRRPGGRVVHLRGGRDTQGERAENEHLQHFGGVFQHDMLPSVVALGATFKPDHHASQWRPRMSATRHVGIWVAAIGLSALLLGCGNGPITITVRPTPSYSFDRPPPSNICPDGSIAWNIHDCHFDLSNP